MDVYEYEVVCCRVKSDDGMVEAIASDPFLSMLSLSRRVCP